MEAILLILKQEKKKKKSTHFNNNNLDAYIGTLTKNKLKQNVLQFNINQIYMYIYIRISIIFFLLTFAHHFVNESRQLLFYFIFLLIHIYIHTRSIIIRRRKKNMYAMFKKIKLIYFV